MFERLFEVEKKYQELNTKLSQPDFIAQTGEYQKMAREAAGLRPLVENFQLYKKIQKQLDENRKLIVEESDESVRELAKQEIPELEAELKRLGEELKIQLLPKDPNDDKSIFLEIRAGTGGEEAALFGSDLFRMYSRYAESRGWRVEIASSSPTGIGGFKEIILQISGDKVYSRLKYESGVHRVQRVPRTEASGRIHTSAATVAVMPEVEEVEVEIADKDLRIDVFRSGGHGGQSVNTTDSAVRITHLPTNMVVVCQDEKSQHKNKAKALKILRARLYDQMLNDQKEAESKTRKEQIKSGDRSEKIRTYNFPQGRVTDHRIGLTVYQLDQVIDGKLDLLIDPLIGYYQAEALKNG